MEMVDQKMEIYRILKTEEVNAGKGEDVQIDIFNTVFNMTKQKKIPVSAMPPSDTFVHF